MSFYLVSFEWGNVTPALRPAVKKMGNAMIDKLARDLPKDGCTHVKTHKLPTGVYLRFEGDAGLVEDYQKQYLKKLDNLSKVGIVLKFEELTTLHG